MRKILATVLTTSALLLALTGCSLSGGEKLPAATASQATAAVISNAPTATTVSATAATPRSSNAASVTMAATSAEYTLEQQPSVRAFAALYSLIHSAKHSLDMTIYELNDPAVEGLLIADAHRGVTVRVLLDKDFSGGKVNATAYTMLRAGKVNVRWAPATTIYHQKTFTVDNTVSAIGTGNFTPQYYATSRDAWVIDRNPAQVHAIEATFNNDFTVTSRTGTSVQAPGLVWSPGAESAMVNVINNAKRTLDVTSEEFKEYNVVGAIAAAARRGVQVRVLLTANSDWNTDFKYVAAAGAQVHVYPASTSALYIHEKIVLADDSTLLIGSQNIGTYSLTRNRELSLLLTDTQAPTVVNAVKSRFNSDFNGADVWSN